MHFIIFHNTHDVADRMGHANIAMIKLIFQKYNAPHACCEMSQLPRDVRVLMQICFQKENLRLPLVVSGCGTPVCDADSMHILEEGGIFNIMGELLNFESSEDLGDTFKTLT